MSNGSSAQGEMTPPRVCWPGWSRQSPELHHHPTTSLEQIKRCGRGRQHGRERSAYQMLKLGSRKHGKCIIAKHWGVIYNYMDRYYIYQAKG